VEAGSVEAVSAEAVSAEAGSAEAEFVSSAEEEGVCDPAPFLFVCRGVVTSLGAAVLDEAWVRSRSTGGSEGLRGLSLDRTGGREEEEGIDWWWEEATDWWEEEGIDWWEEGIDWCGGEGTYVGGAEWWWTRWTSTSIGFDDCACQLDR